MGLAGIITVFVGLAYLVQGLTITSPGKGDRIDIQKGLSVSWTTDSSDKPSANVTIDLFLEESFYMILTSAEGKTAVPITDLDYTFQYTPDKNYIPAQKGYIIRMYDGSSTDFKSDEFEIYNTKDFVTTVSPPTAIPTSVGRIPSSRMPSSTPTSLRNPSTSTTSHAPSASSNAANGITRGNIRADTVFLFTITVPLVYSWVVLRARGEHVF